MTAAAGQALARELGTLWAETSSLTGSGGTAGIVLFSCRAVELQLTGVGAVREAFQLLAESAVLGELHPSAGGGWHTPDHGLLCRLHNNHNHYNTSRPATPGCALQ